MPTELSCPVSVPQTVGWVPAPAVAKASLTVGRQHCSRCTIPASSSSSSSRAGRFPLPSVCSSPEGGKEEEREEQKKERVQSVLRKQTE